MAGERVHLHLRAHIPHTADGVTAARHEHVQRGVQRHSVHAREVAVVLADAPVRLEVPALDHLVLAGGKEVRVPRAHGQRAHGVYVAGERDLQHACGEVPNLNRAVRCARDEPEVARIHC